GVTIVFPIVYGNVATLLPQKKVPDSDHTHKWTVSVKGINGQEIGHFVKKVTFKLHETYSNPQRVVEHPPFEITETGWGEFELSIKLQFIEGSEKPVTLYHNLRLHSYEDDGSISTSSKNKPVQSFQYDELVEQDELRKIEEAYRKVQEQMTIYKNRNDKITKELEEVKAELE
ncbi:1483_t:CDS:2, partial [Racocetra fulgida]